MVQGPYHARICPGIVRWVDAGAIVGQFAPAHRAGGGPDAVAGRCAVPGYRR
jgi:hypothetical protein